MVWCSKWAERPLPLEEFILQPIPPETIQDPSENRDRRQNPKAENGVEIMITTPNGKSTEQCAAITSQGETIILLTSQIGGLFENCVTSRQKKSSCEDGEQNRNIERIMNEMGVKFFTIIDPGCPDSRRFGFFSGAGSEYDAASNSSLISTGGLRGEGNRG